MIGNAIQVGIALIIGIISLVSAICFKAPWHIGTAIMCFVVAYVFYVDDAYNESVKHYIQRKRGK